MNSRKGRDYGVETLARLRFVRHAQDLWFSLDEVAELLAHDEGRECDEARRIADAKLATVRERLSRLRRIERALAEHVRACERSRSAARSSRRSRRGNDQPRVDVKREAPPSAAASEASGVRFGAALKAHAQRSSASSSFHAPASGAPCTIAGRPPRARNTSVGTLFAPILSMSSRL